MDSIKSRVSYLNGLIDGLGIGNDSKEGKAVVEIASILKDMANELELLNYAQDDIEEYVDAIDEDLNDLEDDFYGECEDDDDYDEYEDDDDDYIELECPHCNEVVYIDKDICDDNEKITCPNCHEAIDIDCCDCCE